MKRARQARPENEPVEAAFYSYADDTTSENFKKNSSEALQGYGVAKGSRYNDFTNLAPNVSARPEFTSDHYDYFRPSEATPKKLCEIIDLADKVYQRVGLIRNVIDLMGDFTVQGIRISHPVKNIERFYQRWFESIDGAERSERFANNLYRTGNVIVRKSTHRATLGDFRNLKRAKGAPDSERPIEEKPTIRELPNKYTFLNPNTIEPIGGALASFVGNRRYAIKLPPMLARMIKSPKKGIEEELVAQLPDEIKEAAKTNKPYPLPEDKTSVYHYKKDDWLPWAYPMIYAILDYVKIFNKLMLADMAALDGAISKVRIFRLGNLEFKIAPTRAAAERLADMLQNNVGGGCMDLIWGQDIDIVESNTDLHEFLGEEKYKPCLNAIYAGLGIPPTLTGTFGAAGTTNNFISLRTLTERLQYGRRILTDFWNYELRLIQKSFDFAQPPIVEFDIMNLANEEAMMALYIQLADRDIISHEALSKIFKQPYQIEQVRINREHKDRGNGGMVPKSSPFHDPQIDNSLKKIALQSGNVTPSEVGLQLSEKKKGETTVLDKQLQLKKTQMSEKKNGGTGGRPINKKDSKKRKTKKFTPRGRAILEAWAGTAQEQIASILNPIILENYGKANLRQLTNTETFDAEQVKCGVLFMMEPFSDINSETVVAALDTKVPSHVVQLCEIWTKALRDKLNREPTFAELHMLYNSLYASYRENLNG